MAATTSHGIALNDLAAAEMKFLQRTYENDPLSKRLQRLELLTFGATQNGSDAARWHNLEHYLLNKASKKNSAAAVPGASAYTNISHSLNELEKYVFKRTSPSESTRQRLNKLEAKLFGKPSINMPVEQRVARLQRTLGIASSRQQMAEVPYNFAPGTINPYNNMPYTQPGIPGIPGMQSPFGFNNDDLADPELNQFESQMSQIFREMQKQMQEQQNRALPRQMPRRGAPQIVPQPNVNPGEKVPTYNDPNFI